MPRRLLKRIVPAPHALRDRWFVRLLGGERIADPHMWTLHRRAVTAAFGAGLAISFVPLPVHFLLAVCAAVIWRINLPVAYGTTFIVNPFTAVPIYYAAYRVGAALLHLPRQHFKFHPTWEWLRHGLAPVWEPFVTGCIACAVVCGLLGWLGLEMVWRWHVTSRYRARHAAQSV